MIDISDGLSTELRHLCQESKVGAWIAEAAVPVAPGAQLGEALHGGDEYELLFTAKAGMSVFPTALPECRYVGLVLSQGHPASGWLRPI
jgi:thiamine monophosphate kinase